MEEGSITTLLGANGAGKTTTLARALRHGPAAGRGALSRRAHRRPGHRGHRPPRHRPRARGPRHVRPPVDRREPAPRRLRPQGPGRGGAGLRAHLRLLPAPGRAAPPAGRHALGRRAADARGVARADAAAAPAAARRAFLRPGAADRARAVRDPAHDQPEGAGQHPAGRAERGDGARPGRPRLPDRDRARGALGQRRAKSRTTTPCARPISATRTHSIPWTPFSTRLSPASPPAASTPASRWRWS